MRTINPIAPLLATGCVLAGVVPTADAGLVINVGFNAQQTTVNVGQQFVIDIVADLPLDIVGWGMQFSIQNPAVLELQGPPLVALPWNPTTLIENNGSWQFGGLAFPDPVTGNGTLLASLVFKATALGETDLILTIDGNDPTQGFVAGPNGPPGHFGSYQLNLGHVTVVPGPGALALLGVLLPGGVHAGRRARTRR